MGKQKAEKPVAAKKVRYNRCEKASTRARALARQEAHARHQKKKTRHLKKRCRRLGKEVGGRCADLDTLVQATWGRYHRNLWRAYKRKKGLVKVKPKAIPVVAAITIEGETPKGTAKAVGE